MAIQRVFNGRELVWTFPSMDDVRFNVVNAVGESVWDSLPQIARDAVVHGFAQSAGDRAAMSRDPATGAPATMATKRAAIAARVKVWTDSKVWSVRGGSAVDSAALMAELTKLKESIAKAGIKISDDGSVVSI